MKKRADKTLAVLLVLVMCLALLPAQALAAVDIQANHPALTVNASVIGFAGQEWWVIGYNGSGVYSQSGTATLLLKSDTYPYGGIEFRKRAETQLSLDWNEYGGGWYEGSFINYPSEYADSTLQRRMEEIASEFPSKELALINARTLTALSDNISGAEVPDQKLWPVSYNEWDIISNSTVLDFGDNGDNDDNIY